MTSGSHASLSQESWSCMTLVSYLSFYTELNWFLLWLLGKMCWLTCSLSLFCVRNKYVCLVFSTENKKWFGCVWSIFASTIIPKHTTHYRGRRESLLNIQHWQSYTLSWFVAVQFLNIRKWMIVEHWTGGCDCGPFVWYYAITLYLHGFTDVSRTRPFPDRRFPDKLY